IKGEKMKKMIALAIMFVGVNALAQTSKVLMYCDYIGATQADDIYVDLYVDYDAATDLYSNLEAGVFANQTDTYPDYLWSVALWNQAGNTVTNVTMSKNADSLSFDLPTLAKSNGSINFDIPKADGKITDFNVNFKGTYKGAAVDQSFLCYDPSTKQQPGQR
ncbi:hypothetical protein K2X05_08135, partial [bacterium]|nr:hypothetical protein [bacterium]